VREALAAHPLLGHAQAVDARLFTGP
jgi:hypothetical protein